MRTPKTTFFVCGRMGLFAFSLVLACVISTKQFVVADLPIHAVTNDIHGLWRFFVGALSDSPNPCQSGVPNMNVENLMNDPRKWFKEHQQPSDEFTLLLSDTPILVNQTVLHSKLPPSLGHHKSTFLDSRRRWSVLPVYSDRGLVGHWTMVYDEGFEVTVGPAADQNTTQLLAFVKYNRTSDANCASKSVANGDNEMEDGSTPCYETDPTRTMVGWRMVADAATGGKKFGCFVAEKQKNVGNPSSEFPRYREVRATVQEVPSRGKYSDMGMHSYRKTSRMLAAESRPILPSFLQLESKMQLGMTTGLYACTKPQEDKTVLKSLPDTFSWGDPFTDPNFSPVGDELLFNQGHCGACYAVTAAYVLQRRSQILLERLLGRRDEWKKLFADGGRISPQAPMSCSYYNQACDGGFPYLVGKWASEFGAPSLDCMEYHAADTECVMEDINALTSRRPRMSERSQPPAAEVGEDLTNRRQMWRNSPIPLRTDNETKSSAPRKRKASSGTQKILSPMPEFLQRNASSGKRTQQDACQDTERVYAANYGYVGGCYECCSETAMMNEIYNHGPVGVAFDAPPELFTYRGGVFDKKPPSHSRVCDDPEKGLNGWEFTTHALVVVGWGEEPGDIEGGAPVKYWIARNSWGPGWGSAGFVKLLRGQNQGALEAQAVYIDPDPTRGKLKAVLDRYAVADTAALTALSAGMTKSQL